MRQLTQKLKNGSMQVLDVPIAALQGGHVLVKNHYSVISAGTEGTTVTTARKSLLSKAKERPQQVKQVIDTLKSQGIVQTYRAVMKKLDAYSPLGYSCAGEVVELAGDVQGFQIGDLVACGGLTACHAEMVSVPSNLCVKVHPDSDLRLAAYNTLGAIALQGVRQADLCLGETCAVIGLGLIGQLTGQLLRAAGVRTVGIDIDSHMVAVASKGGFDLALTRDTSGIEDVIHQFTGGFGCDAVIITAGSTSLDPINFAGAISRKRGTIVVVGAVPTGYDREPHFYKKELQVKMSCSYGPGRYDHAYEEKGVDYPHAYVRWTENRNMQAFQELIYTKELDLSHLTTHTFKLEDAPAAYDLILKKSEPFIGVLIEYDHGKEQPQGKVVIHPERCSAPASASIGFVGAGSYAQSHLLPNIPKNEKVVLKGVMTSSGTSSRSVADRFGFEFCTSQESDLLKNDSINTLFIATRHDSHAYYVQKAIEAGKNVFVEKPLCLRAEELDQIRDVYSTAAANAQSAPLLMVGYNRRFSPLTKFIKKTLPDGPMAMVYRINAGKIPPDSWIQDVELGGGRIIGEACHFVDYLTYINGSFPTTVSAVPMTDPLNLNDTVLISLSYENGSIGSISYFANGDKSLPKEHVEIYTHGVTAILNDFKSVTLHARGKRTEKKLLNQDKGQKEQVKLFIDAILNGTGSPIPFDQIYSTSYITFKILESISTGQIIRI